MKNSPLFILLLMTSNLALKAQADSIKHHILQPDSLPGNMLIIHSFDVMSSKTRKNKKELFMELVDSLKQVLYEATPPPNGGKLIVIPELIRNASDSDSTIRSLMLQNNASKAIVIKYLDAYFNQTHVDVTKEAGGKN